MRFAPSPVIVPDSAGIPVLELDVESGEISVTVLPTYHGHSRRTAVVSDTALLAAVAELLAE